MSDAPLGFIIGTAILFGIVIALVQAANKRRRAHLLSKYSDLTIVDGIMRKRIWQSMSQEQLVDSWGRPAAKDQKVYKTKTVETFKYGPNGKNRFRSRVRVENGVVVGWEQK